MVPGPRIRESRSPLDSRGPLPKWRGASSFYTDRSSLRLHSRHRGLSVHPACGSQPPRGKPRGGHSFLCTVPPCGYTLATTTRQYESLVAHGPLPRRRGASSFFVRTAPPGGCALAITAGQYRPPMARSPLSGTLGGPFLFCVPPVSPPRIPPRLRLRIRFLPWARFLLHFKQHF